MKIYVKKFYGFTPENVPVITFSRAGSRDKLLEEASTGDCIIYECVNGPPVPEDERGKIVGMAQIGNGALSTKTLIRDIGSLPDYFYDNKGNLKWTEGIPMEKAWRFDPPLDRQKILRSETIQNQATRTTAIELSEEEAARVLSKPKNKIELPKIVEDISKHARSYSPPKESKKSNRVFGHIPGIKVGTLFPNRAALREAGLHKPNQAGISGSQKEGADSLVVSGGYEDDLDFGDEIIYTGHGGNDRDTGKQTSDQSFTGNNLALAQNERLGLPIRVIRGAGGNPETSPESGYRYDGLYFVESHWEETGASGFKIFRYRLLRDNSASQENENTRTPQGNAKPHRKETTTLRIVRDTKVSNWVKELHDYKCQVCGIAIETPMGRYAEGAHIVPLAAPHNGEDVKENMLCLCPNHHVAFDKGSFSIADDWSLLGLKGSLRRLKEHPISKSSIQRHRILFGY